MVGCDYGMSDKSKNFQGLKLILGYKTNIDARNVRDETATVMAANKSSTEALKILVCSIIIK